MRKVLLSIALLLTLSTSSAQAEKQVKLEGKVFSAIKAENKAKKADTKTAYMWEDNKGNQYPIYIGAKGGVYVIRTSAKTGKEYKYYLPKEIAAEIKSQLKK